MPNNKSTFSGSYHDVLIRSGFIGCHLEDSPLPYNYTYIKRFGDKVIFIDVYSSHWKVSINLFSSSMNDRLEVLHLDKSKHANEQELNEDIDRNSYKQLQLLEQRSEIDFGLIK